jgi:hypothetical protein
MESRLSCDLSEAKWILNRDSALINTDDIRHLLTCNGGRVTIIRRACRILSEGIVDGYPCGYLIPIRHSRWGVRPLGHWKCETITRVGGLMYPKATQAVLSREKKKEVRDHTRLRRRSLLVSGASVWQRLSL